MCNKVDIDGPHKVFRFKGTILYPSISPNSKKRIILLSKLFFTWVLVKDRYNVSCYVVIAGDDNN